MRCSDQNAIAASSAITGSRFLPGAAGRHTEIAEHTCQNIRIYGYNQQRLFSIQKRLPERVMIRMVKSQGVQTARKSRRDHMKKFEVLGTGCKKCTNTAEAIEQVARELNQEVEVTKITDPASIMTYQVMSTPAVVLEGKVVHGGSIPGRAQIIGWLTS